MRVRILGDVVVEVDGSVVPLPRAKERALLAILALRSNQALSVDQLVEIIWGQDPPASAVRSLRSHVSRLRSSIGEDALLTIGSAYALSISDDAVDSNEFVRLIESAERLPALGARSALTEALALWRGRPFTELADSSRAQAEATRLAELRVGAELALVDLRLADGEHEALVAPLEVLIAEHPGREDLWRRLVLALHRSHRRADALRAFQRARSVLMEQMGLEPGSDLVELERLVVAGSPVLDGSDAGPASAISTHDAATPVQWSTRHRFVGRSEALAGLETAWDETLNSRVGVVVVRGDPGAGKTALLTEFVSRREQGTLVAYGVADHDLQAPFLAVSDVVRSLIDQAPESALRGDPDNLDGLLDEVFVGSGASTHDAAPGDVTSEFDSARLLSATERLFERIDGRRPILVLLDDVQWIDRASAALVRRWARQQGRQLLIVLSCRSHGLQEPATRLLDDLMIAGGLTSIELGGLSTEEVALLLADQPELDPRELTMRTGGNPFLLHQLASHDDPGSLPDGVTAMIGARVRELPDSTRSVLEVAAISAGTIEAEVLALVLGEPVDEVIARLDPAVDAGLLEEDPDEFGHYLFDHDLIAEAVRANVSHNRSTLLHRQLAEAIGARLGGPTDAMVFAVAGHLRAGLAEIPDQVRAALAAGRLARRTLAFDDAAAWLEPALEMAESDPGIDQEIKRGILLETGRVRGLRRQRGARRALLQAAELASAGDLVDVAIELSRFNHARFTSRADSEVIDVIKRALAHIDDDQAEKRALLTAALAAELMWVTSIDTRCALADEALEIARDRDDAVLLGSVILRTQLAASSPDNLSRRLADGRVVIAALDRPNALGSFASSGHEALIAGGVALATATFESGEIDAAIELLARVRELSADAAHWALSWRVTSLEVAIALFQARFATAERQLGELMAPKGAANSPQAMLAMRGWSQLLIDRGDHTSLEAAIGDFARDAPEVPGWSSALAVVLCELGRHDEAAPLLAKTIAAPMFEDRNLGWLTHRAADCFVARELADRTAMEVLRSVLAPYEGQLCLDIIASMGPVDLALGMVAGGLDDHQAALDHLGAAADLCERSGAPIWQARCHLETARVFAGMRCDDDASRSARLAFDAASAAGGRHVALVAEQMLNGQDH